MPTVLVTGFGPFLDVVDNPSGHLAHRVHGARVGDLLVVGMVLPVSHRRAPALTLAAAAQHDCVAIVGLGLARGRDRVCVESTAWAALDPTLRDVDGEPGRLLPGPPSLDAPFPCAAFARPLDALVSPDPGRYVCDAWLYTVCRGRRPAVQVGFVHLPDTGLSSERLLLALAVLNHPPPIAGSADARGRPASC